MPTASINGQSVFYDDTRTTGPVLLFNHGLLMDREMFAPQIEVLREKFRCITWDQRGFGLTGEARAPFTYWDSAGDALALLDHLEIPSATWIGMSQGGFLSLRAALAQPRRVKALVLISTRSDIEPKEVLDNLDGLRVEWSANGAKNLKGPLGEILLGKDENVQRPWLKKWDGLPKTALDIPIKTLITRDDITHRLTEITCPALIIHGEADAGIPIAAGEFLAQSLANAKGFVRVPGGSHACNLTHPEIVNPPLVDFVERWGGL